MSPTALQKLRQIRAFTMKHRPTLRKAAVRALEIEKDPENAKKNVVMVYMVEREAALTELSYYVASAEVVPIEHFGDRVVDMRDLMKSAHEQGKKAGFDMRAMLVVMADVDNALSNVVPIGFQVPVTPSSLDPEVDWKDWMVEQLNEGILR
ncbi:hypothetical protein BDN72DRAFT_847656 [Pluteus cervinus]|uniref:Uncharacterized protein n=1 Tax=Pluteus cervinus TaxID=181527 RepID=A0ACD3ABZ2_9AGAR|nr:hypothetical protein BDN72DRAFT_847656 [Pluteus cervinus]